MRALLLIFKRQGFKFLESFHFHVERAQGNHGMAKRRIGNACLEQRLAESSSVMTGKISKTVLVQKISEVSMIFLVRE
jgi:hypothetical protein